MNKFANKMKLKEMAEEDIYFAKRDRELIEALRQRRLKAHVQCTSEDSKDQAKAYEKKFKKITRKHRNDAKSMIEAYRKLIRKIRKKCASLAV